jgi:hypothetical protein
MDHSLNNDSNATNQSFNGEAFVDAMQVGDHAERFEALHQKLNQALSSIDGM